MKFFYAVNKISQNKLFGSAVLITSMWCSLHVIGNVRRSDHNGFTEFRHIKICCGIIEALYLDLFVLYIDCTCVLKSKKQNTAVSFGKI